MSSPFAQPTDAFECEPQPSGSAALKRSQRRVDEEVTEASDRSDSMLTGEPAPLRAVSEVFSSCLTMQSVQSDGKASSQSEPAAGVPLLPATPSTAASAPIATERNPLPKKKAKKTRRTPIDELKDYNNPPSRKAARSALAAASTPIASSSSSAARLPDVIPIHGSPRSARDKRRADKKPKKRSASTEKSAEQSLLLATEARPQESHQRKQQLAEHDYQRDCFECGGHFTQKNNLILVCDLCDRHVHQQCCEPRVREIPDGDWFCGSCAQYIKQFTADSQSSSKQAQKAEPAVKPDADGKRSPKASRATTGESSFGSSNGAASSNSSSGSRASAKSADVVEKPGSGSGSSSSGSVKRETASSDSDVVLVARSSPTKSKKRKRSGGAKEKDGDAGSAKRPALGKHVSGLPAQAASSSSALNAEPMDIDENGSAPPTRSSSDSGNSASQTPATGPASPHAVAADGKADVALSTADNARQLRPLEESAGDGRAQTKTKGRPARSVRKHAKYHDWAESGLPALQVCSNSFHAAQMMSLQMKCWKAIVRMLTSCALGSVRSTNATRRMRLGNKLPNTKMLIIKSSSHIRRLCRQLRRNRALPGRAMPSRRCRPYSADQANRAGRESRANRAECRLPTLTQRSRLCSRMSPCQWKLTLSPRRPKRKLNRADNTTRRCWRAAAAQAWSAAMQATRRVIKSACRARCENGAEQR